MPKLEKFIPQTPDPFLKQPDQLGAVKFGHLNALVDSINATVYGDYLQLEGDGPLSTTLRAITDPEGNLANLYLATNKTAISGSLKVGVAGTALSSAVVDIESTTQGVLLPRMTAAERDSIVSPDNGLIIYNTDESRLNSWNGVSWLPLATNKGVLQTPNALDGTLQKVEDQSGNLSPLYLSTTEVNAKGSGNSSTQLGVGASASGSNAISIGLTSQAIQSNSIAIGSLAIASGSQSIAIGINPDATNTSAIAFGNSSQAIGGNSISIGLISNASGTNAISIGANSDATQSGTISIGNTAQATGGNAISIGGNSQAIAVRSIALGVDAKALQSYAVSIGDNTQANYLSVSLGNNATGYTSQYSTSIGANAKARTNSSIALGFGADARTGSSSIVIGSSAVVDGGSGISIGNTSQVVGGDGIAIGRESFADVGGVAIGSGANAGVNEISFGSATSNTGAVTSETVTSDATWTVNINGTTYKILLKA